jgi:AraC-like DNA-binding protein
MSVVFDEVPSSSDSPLVETIWRSRSDQVTPFTSQAINHWEIVIWRHEGKSYVTIRGPETKATPAASQKDAEYLGIQFKLGTYMPHLPTIKQVDGEILLPKASSQAVWLKGSAWQIPDFDDADAFVARLERQGLVQRDPVVQAVLEGQPQELSSRTVRRRFLYTVGLAPKTHQQIERARMAQHLLGQGIPIADVVFQAGYADQAHLTRSLKHFVGKTPAALILAPNDFAPQTSPYRWRNTSE